MTLALNQVHVGDARELLRQVDDDSINCVVTSPPYWGLRDYGVEGQIGLERSPWDFVDAMVELFREVRRALRPDGVVWLNLGDCYATGAGKAGESPGGGEQGARWRGDVERLRDDKRGYRGDRLANGRGDQPAVLRQKTRATRDGTHAGKHTAMAAMGPMTQSNRMPIVGLKPKDLIGLPWRVAFALQSDGWWLRRDVIWHKPNPMPESVRDRPTTAHEYLFLLTRSERYWYDADAIREPATAPEASTASDAARAFSRRRSSAAEVTQDEVRAEDLGGKNERHIDRRKIGFNERWTDGEGGPARMMRNKRSVWTIAPQPTPENHFAAFPEDLVTPCVLAGCPAGGVVLDPFAGTGTVARVAEDLGRRWIAIELNADYAEMARRRLRQQGISWPTQPPAAPTEEEPSPRPEPPTPARAATERREPREGVSGAGPDVTAIPPRREPHPPKRLTVIGPDGKVLPL